MTTALTLAKPDHLDVLCTLCTAFHAEAQISMDHQTRRGALQALLEGMPYGVAYLMGPLRAPVGYLVLTFSWSIEFGGLDGMIDELYVRPAVRGRGIAREALIALPRALTRGGLRAVHLEVRRDNAAAIRLYQRAGFAPRENYILMSKQLS
ncbi:MAG: N-acetyltransferase [Pseudomonadota bacterium]